MLVWSHLWQKAPLTGQNLIVQWIGFCPICTSLNRHRSTVIQKILNKTGRTTGNSSEKYRPIYLFYISPIPNYHCVKVWSWLDKDSGRNTTPIFGHIGIKTRRNQRKLNVFGPQGPKITGGGGDCDFSSNNNVWTKFLWIFGGHFEFCWVFL